jgi:hypothetical protein
MLQAIVPLTVNSDPESYQVPPSHTHQYQRPCHCHVLQKGTRTCKYNSVPRLIWFVPSSYLVGAVISEQIVLVLTLE